MKNKALDGMDIVLNLLLLYLLLFILCLRYWIGLDKILMLFTVVCFSNHGYASLVFLFLFILYSFLLRIFRGNKIYCFFF